MNKLLALGVVALTMGMPAMTLSGSQHGVGRKDVRGEFAGAWRLASLEEEGADGKVQRADATGLLVYTHDGHMAVQVMSRNPQTELEPAAKVPPVQYVQGGYEASFGTYTINESAHTFTFHVEGALVRSLIGKDLPRTYELADKQLTVKSTDAKEHWRVVWRREEAATDTP